MANMTNMTNSSPPYLSPDIHYEMPTWSQFQTLAGPTIRAYVMSIPRQVISMAILYCYLLIPHVNRYWLYQARWLVLILICLIEYENIMGCQSIFYGRGHGEGLIASMTIMWAGTWLVWEAPQFTAKRVERRARVKSVEVEEIKCNTAKSTDLDMLDKSTLRDRNGTMSTSFPSKSHIPAPASPTNITTQSQEWEYYWQSYPTNFKARLSWTADLLFNCRGPGWNWAIPILPSMPPHILTALSLPQTPTSKTGLSKTGLQRVNTKSQIYSIIIPHALICYALAHFCLAMFMTDPYFILGPNNTAPLPTHLALLHPLLVTCIRRALIALTILSALELNNNFLLHLLLGPKYLGLRGEIWYYHTTFGTMSNITQHSLAGFWGGFWHQTFRKAFTAPSEYLIRKGWLSRRATSTKLVSLFIAFGISAGFHAAAFVSTSAMSAWPFFAFFSSQLPGVVLQIALEVGAKKVLPTDKIPRWVKQGWNLIYAAVWLLITSGGAVEQSALATSKMYQAYLRQVGNGL